MTQALSTRAEPTLSTRTISLGTLPDPGSVHGLAVAGPHLLATYYPESGAGRLVVLDRRSLAVIGKAIRVGHYPRKVSWHPGRNAAYVLNSGQQSYSISIVDLATRDVADVPLGNGILDVTVDPIADLVYVTNRSDRLLHVLDAGDPSRRRTIRLPSVPHGVAVDVTGDVPGLVYIALSLPSDSSPIGALAIVDAEGHVTTRPIIPSGSQPGPLTMGPAGLVYVGTVGGESALPKLAVYDADTGEELGSVGTAAGVRALAADPPVAAVWVATDAGVQLIDATNPFAPAVRATTETGRSPHGVAVDDDGVAYVGDDRDGTITAVTAPSVTVPPAAVTRLLGQAGYQTGGRGPAATAEALRAYQRFHHLAVTGRPDRATIAHLTAPGCGNADSPTSATDRFVLIGDRWDYIDITYYLGDMRTPIGLPKFTDELKAQVIAAAFDAWNKILGIFRFTRVFDPTQADIEFRVGHDPIFNDGPFKETYAVCKYNDDIGKRGARIPIIFNREKRWAAHGYLDSAPPAGESSVDMVHVATHEIGHALGLYHSGVEKTVMYRKATWYRVPKPDDEAGFRALYGRFALTAAGDPFGYKGPAPHHVVYRSTGEDIVELFIDSTGNWAHKRVTAAADAPKAGGSPHAYITPGNVHHVVYRSTANQIVELFVDSTDAGSTTS